MKRSDKEFVEKIVELTHGRDTRIDYHSGKDVEIINLLIKMFIIKRPGQFTAYLEKVKEIRHNRGNRKTDSRIIALMPAYLDMMIKAVWRNQQFDAEFYRWFLREFNGFQLPEGNV